MINAKDFLKVAIVSDKLKKILEIEDISFVLEDFAELYHKQEVWRNSSKHWKRRVSIERYVRRYKLQDAKDAMRKYMRGYPNFVYNEDDIKEYKCVLSFERSTVEYKINETYHGVRTKGGVYLMLAKNGNAYVVGKKYFELVEPK